MTAYWYAIQSKPNKEDALFNQLETQGFEVFYPRVRVNPVNPRAKKIKAYFPGYMFVNADIRIVGLSTLQWMPFTRGIVTFDQEPATVPDALIAALRKRLDDESLLYGPGGSNLRRGEPVTIQYGPFAGYEGIFDLSLSGGERVRVLIQLLSQRQMPIELQIDQIKRKDS